MPDHSLVCPESCHLLTGESLVVVPVLLAGTLGSVKRQNARRVMRDR
jgi:hypothetical protein